jgi:hypothetical protein
MLQLADNHDLFRQRLARRVSHYRKKLLIPPRWQIDVKVLCPEEMEEHYGEEGIQASIAWQPFEYANYRMRMSCEVPDDTVDWLIMHELLEAVSAPYAVFTNQLIEKQRGKFDLDSQHRIIRDDMIEWMLAIIAPDKRPSVGDRI